MSAYRWVDDSSPVETGETGISSRPNARIEYNIIHSIDKFLFSGFMQVEAVAYKTLKNYVKLKRNNVCRDQYTETGKQHATCVKSGSVLAWVYN